MSDLTDEQLMLAYAKGDAVAFETLYLRHKGGIYRYCLRQLGNAARAEECFQEVWIKIVNNRVNYQPKALFTTYLYRIAYHQVIDLVRKDKHNKRHTTLDESVDYMTLAQGDISDDLIERNTGEQLRLHIQALPLEQKTALLLKLDAGLSLAEIGEVLECSRETVKSRLRYATAKLKQMLGETT